MFRCDTARITSPCGTHFLILGRTKNINTERGAGRDFGEIPGNGSMPSDFDFTHEQVVARGSTVRELIASALKYKSLLRTENTRRTIKNTNP
jgi:hypothetical protein